MLDKSRLRTGRKLSEAMILVGADLLGFFVAFLFAGLIALVISETILKRPYEVLADRGLGRAIEFAIFSTLVMTWLGLQGRYSQRSPFWNEFGQVTQVCLLALLGDGFLQYAVQLPFSRSWLILTWLISPLSLIATRLGARRLLKRLGMWTIQMVVIGPSHGIERAQTLLSEVPSMGHEIVACVDTDSQESFDWHALLVNHRAEGLILCLSDERLRQQTDEIRKLALHDIPFLLLRDMEGLPVSSLQTRHIMGREAVLLCGGGGLGNSIGRRLKTIFDRVAATFLLILTLPLLLTIALLIRTEGGPVFFLHERIGRKSKPFHCIKFRTMNVNAPQRLEDMLALNPQAREEWERYRKIRNDPRITPLGRWLRRTSLDELPQLVNVLLGDMSLVGPRPVTREETVFYGDDFPFYAICRPGITGLWQVNGRNDADIVRRIELDRWYTVNWSFGLDLILLIKTVRVLITREGAY